MNVLVQLALLMKAPVDWTGRAHQCALCGDWVQDDPVAHLTFNAGMFEHHVCLERLKHG